MKKQNKILLILFIIGILLRVIAAFFIKSPTIFSDEYVYVKIAQSFFEEQNFLLNDNPVAKYPPLYSILISISYLFNNMPIIYFFIKVINSVLLASVIFPLFFLAKDFLSSKKALMISFVATLIGPYFIFSNFVMAENLYFPLAIWAVFFMYKALVLNKWQYFLFAGIFSGLAVLTKLFGLALFPIIGLLWLFYRKRVSFRNVIIYYTSALLVVVPWFIRNFLVFGGKASSITAGYKSPWMLSQSLSTKLIPFLNWNLTYWGYLLVGSGIIFFVYFLAFRKIKSQQLKFISFITLIYTFFTVFIASNLSTNYKFQLLHILSPWLLPGRIVGRYVEVVLPLIIVIGYIVYDRAKNVKISKFEIIFSFVLILLSVQLMSNALFPLNNSALSIFGLIQKAIAFVFHFSDFVLLLIATIIMLLTLLFYFLYMIYIKKFILFLAIFLLLLNSLIGFSMIYWNSALWYSSDQVDISNYINDNVSRDTTIFIDEDYCQNVIDKRELDNNLCDKGNYASLMGFFITNKIKIVGSEGLNDGDVFISKTEYQWMKKLVETQNGIIVYET